MTDITSSHNETGAARIDCFCCGVCCRKHQARLSREEAAVVAAGLGITFEQFVAQYTDPRWPDPETFLFIHRSGGCVFLQQSQTITASLCSIYAFRPSPCREWQASLELRECREGLRTCWGLTVGPLNRIEADPEKLKIFGDFVRSLGAHSVSEAYDSGEESHD